MMGDIQSLVILSIEGHWAWMLGLNSPSWLCWWICRVRCECIDVVMRCRKRNGIKSCLVRNDRRQRHRFNASDLYSSELSTTCILHSIRLDWYNTTCTTVMIHDAINATTPRSNPYRPALLNPSPLPRPMHPHNSTPQPVPIFLPRRKPGVDSWFHPVIPLGRNVDLFSWCISLNDVSLQSRYEE
jgi:hypothetical protein